METAKTEELLNELFGSKIHPNNIKLLMEISQKTAELEHLVSLAGIRTRITSQILATVPETTEAINLENIPRINEDIRKRISICLTIVTDIGDDELDIAAQKLGKEPVRGSQQIIISQSGLINSEKRSTFNSLRDLKEIFLNKFKINTVNNYIDEYTDPSSLNEELKSILAEIEAEIIHIAKNVLISRQKHIKDFHPDELKDMDYEELVAFAEATLKNEQEIEDMIFSVNT